MAGLPLSTWLLLLASVGIGLAIELVFYARHRSRRLQTSDRNRPR